MRINLSQKLNSFYLTAVMFWASIMSARLAARPNWRSGVDISEWIVAVFVGLILFAIALTISAPLINGLTTGATPTIAPTSTTGTLVGYIILFVVLGFILAILAGAIYLYRHGGNMSA